MVLSVLALLLCQGMLSLGVVGRLLLSGLLLLDDSLEEGWRATDAEAGPEPRFTEGFFAPRVGRVEAKEAVLPVVLLLHLRSRE